MSALILRRHAPDWASAAAEYTRSGRFDASRLLPRDLPHGFPRDVARRIDFWNQEFDVDYFSCRARLAEISLRSCLAVQDAEVVAVGDVREASRKLRSGRYKLCLFVDDDDWFAPNVVSALRGSVLAADVIRWCAPIFRGALVQRSVPTRFPRWSFRLQRYFFRRGGATRRLLNLWNSRKDRDGLDRESINFLVQTNNYAITNSFLSKGGELAAVIDHVRASEHLLHTDFSIASLPGPVLSLTNKHPCAVTQLPALHGAADSTCFRDRVERFLAEGEQQDLPEAFQWAAGLIAETLDLFSEVLATR